VSSTPDGGKHHARFAVPLFSSSFFCLCSLPVLTLLFLSFPHRTLLRLHNLRAVILILNCLTTACEIGRAYLLTTQRTSYAMESAGFFLGAIISTAILLRVIEIRKSRSGEKIQGSLAVIEHFARVVSD
jgi:hypothetical protein